MVSRWNTRPKMLHQNSKRMLPGGTPANNSTNIPKESFLVEPEHLPTPANNSTRMAPRSFLLERARHAKGVQPRCTPFKLIIYL